MSKDNELPNPAHAHETLVPIHARPGAGTSPDALPAPMDARTLEPPLSEMPVDAIGTMMTLGSVAPAVPGSPLSCVVIPGYEILDELGHGGMGVVYKARHVKSNRLVALKMILASLHASVHEKVRFQIEAEAIASLHHPNIVQLYDIGEQDGQPFFSLEFCDGGGLDKALQGQPLPARAAAELVETLARAVHYAHSRGVIHRDLKPANVLLASGAFTRRGMSESGRLHVPLAKIADFGLAKQMDSASDISRSGAIMGTPSYMAPEQALGKTNEVGPPADIYALGAILYECLTGRPPFKGATALEVLEQVRTREPEGLARLAPKTPRDLETICLKCLRKEPANRYATAQDLAGDLRRFLDHEPIQARPVGAAERLWRWGRRNPRVASLFLTLVVVIVSALVSVTLLWQQADTHRKLAETSEAKARRQQEIAEQQSGIAEAQKRNAEASASEARNQQALAESQRQSALAAAEKASRVSEFLGGIFESADPLGLSGYGSIIPKATGESLTVRELLNRGAARIDADQTLAPDTRALIKDRIGNALLGLGEVGKAEPLLRAAMELREKHFGLEHSETALSVHNLARLAHVRGDYFKAEKLYRQALALRLKLSPLPEVQIADTEFNLAWLLLEMESLAESADLYRRSIERRVRVLGEKHREVGIARLGLAGAYVEQGDYLKALDELRLGQEIVLAREGSGKIAEAASLFLDAVISGELTNNRAASEKKLLKCLALSRSSLPDRHMYIAIVLFQLGQNQEEQGKDAEAEKYYRECLDIGKSQIGLAHPRASLLIHNLTKLLRRTRRSGQAQQLFDEWIAAHRARPGPFLADALTVYAGFLSSEGKEERERTVLEEALALYRKEPVPPQRGPCILCLRDLGWNYVRAGRNAEAEKLASEYLTAAGRRHGEKSNAVAFALNQRSVAQLNQGKTGPEVEESLKQARIILKPLNPFAAPSGDLANICHNLSVLYRLRGQPGEAVPYARESRGQCTDVGQLLQAAREFAWCSSDVLRLNPKATLDQQEESRRYADEAMKTLKQAKSRGLKDAALLNGEAAFSCLRSRTDYHELLRELETKKP